MKDIRSSLLIIFMFLSGGLFAQPDSLSLREIPSGTLKRLGQNALKQNDPGSAAIYLEAYLKRNRKDAAATALLGEAYREMREYEKAQRVYLRAYTISKEKAPEALYHHAQMQKSNGQFDSAAINFRQFKKVYKGPQKSLKKRATQEILFCDSVQQIAKKDPKLLIERLDTTINKVNSEGAVVNLDDSTLLFSSLRTDRQEYIIEDDTSGATIKKKLYMARYTDNSWHFAGEYPWLASESHNTGNVSFSADRQRMYFTRCKPNLMEEMICAIYVSELKGGNWSEPQKLPKPVNLPGFTSTMPAVTTDPARGYDLIYFISNRKGGRGGQDIWYTMYNKKKGVYTEPKNAGSKINTSSDEITPWFDNETRTLYFSSDGPGGMGGFDIYRAIGDGKRWSGAANMGQPLNSGADDVYYTIAPGRQEGFFVSNRKGGVALKNSTCCDDIYMYRNTDYINIRLSGTFADAGDSLPVPNATMEVYVTDRNSRERFLVKSVLSDSLGNYSLRLEPDQDYVLIARKKEFLSTAVDLSTRDITSSRNIRKDAWIRRKPKGTIIIPNIEYEFARAELTEKSKHIIDSVLFTLLENNPDIVVQINSHTDSKGNDQFNMKLSQKRAESTIRYLNGKGISMNRMLPKGFGESLPIAPNDLPDGSDNPEGRARNRRTEFQIIGTINLDTDDEEEQIEVKEGRGRKNR